MLPAQTRSFGNLDDAWEFIEATMMDKAIAEARKLVESATAAGVPSEQIEAALEVVAARYFDALEAARKTLFPSEPDLVH